MDSTAQSKHVDVEPLDAVRSIPMNIAKNNQYDLFTKFLGSNKELSNTIELWDAIPKYAVSLKQQSKMRDSNNRLPVLEHEFEYRSTSPSLEKKIFKCTVKIHPASIKTEHGYMDFYPSANEELAEEVLRKLFSDQQYGFHDLAHNESWVQFTIHRLREELKAHEKTRSYDEVTRSIDIMGHCVFDISLNNSTDSIAYTGPILTDITRVNRQKYLVSPKQRWCARLPALITKSVNDLTYRQFDYGRQMNFKSPLARWFHKRLSHQYTNASYQSLYNIMFTSIYRDSRLLVHSRTSKNIATVEAALDELKTGNVVLYWTSEVLRDTRKNKILDVKYDICPTPQFVQDIKAANKRKRDAIASLHPPKFGLISPLLT